VDRVRQHPTTTTTEWATKKTTNKKAILNFVEMAVETKGREDAYFVESRKKNIHCYWNREKDVPSNKKMLAEK
jgi:hypothetical protein